MVHVENPIFKCDYPDPDVIRVGDTYYLASTTMHYFPGCEILRSYDLANWEHAAYVYDRLDSTPGQRLEEGGIYGKGMWAPCLRYHEGMFYLIFCANDTQKTYIYRSESIEGPWRKNTLDTLFHDCSLLFDEGRAFLVHGNTTVRLTELTPDLTAVKEGGLQRVLVVDEGNHMLGLEGSHLYKIGGKYYLFMIHSLPDRWMRTESCYMSDSLEGEFTGGDVLCDHQGYFGMGVAQGGIVDTPDGDWYGILFQDRGGAGRIPVLVPVHFEGEKPVFGVDGKAPKEFDVKSTKEGYAYAPLTGSDDFKSLGEASDLADGRKVSDAKLDSFGMKSFWQINHEPVLSLIAHDTEKGELRITTGKVTDRLDRAVNTFTQRMMIPGCTAQVTLDGSDLQPGDRAGLGAFWEKYSFIGLERTEAGYDLVCSLQGEEISERVSLGDTPKVVLQLSADISGPEGRGTYAWKKPEEEEFRAISETAPLQFTLKHFVGCRFALFVYSTKKSGGAAAFSDFRYL